MLSKNITISEWVKYHPIKNIAFLIFYSFHSIIYPSFEFQLIINALVYQNQYNDIHRYHLVRTIAFFVLYLFYYTKEKPIFSCNFKFLVAFSYSFSQSFT